MGLPCTITDIFSIEHWHDLEIWVMDRSRSLINRSCTTYYWSAFLITTLPGSMCELPDDEKYREHEILVRDQSR